MKIRSDFVTNSSSSSFIIAFHSKEKGLSEIAQMMNRYGSDYIGQLLKDFNAASQIPYEDISKHVDSDIESDADFEICFGSRGWYSSDKDTFERRWMNANPHARYCDFYESDEYKEELTRLKQLKTNELLEDIGDRHYIVELEYEDHSRIGSELEHEILPECDFTVRRFSHH